MAKALGEKSRLIRQAIAANADKGNTELAEMLMDQPERMDDKLKITAQDVATQKQAMKKPGASQPATAAPAPAAAKAGNGRKKPGRKPGRKPAPKAAAAPSSTISHGAPAADVFVHIDAIKAAVRHLGPDQVKRIVGLFE